jgi:hypothetical protein
MDIDNEKPTLEQFIQVYDISHLVPDNFLDVIKDSLPTSSYKMDRTDSDARYSDNIYYLTEETIDPLIHKYIWSITDSITEQYSSYFIIHNDEIEDFNPIRKMFNEEGYFFYMYTEHEYCNIHVDQNRKHPRDISFIIMLNDDYEGGEIEFYCGKHLLKRISPKKNHVVMFPSNYLYAHRIKPVYNGVRCVFVYWLRIN